MAVEGVFCTKGEDGRGTEEGTGIASWKHVGYLCYMELTGYVI